MGTQQSQHSALQHKDQAVASQRNRAQHSTLQADDLADSTQLSTAPAKDLAMDTSTAQRCAAQHSTAARPQQWAPFFPMMHVGARAIYIDWVEVTCRITNDTKARRGRRLLKQPPEVVGLGVAGDGRHWFRLHKSVVDGRGGQVAGPFQEALLVCWAVVPWVS